LTISYILPNIVLHFIDRGEASKRRGETEAVLLLSRSETSASIHWAEACLGLMERGNGAGIEVGGRCLEFLGELLLSLFVCEENVAV